MNNAEISSLYYNGIKICTDTDFWIQVSYICTMKIRGYAVLIYSKSVIILSENNDNTLYEGTIIQNGI